MNDEEKICCICNKKFIGYGNSPWPIQKTGLCCDRCNANVIFERLNLTKRKTIRKRRITK